MIPWRLELFGGLRAIAEAQTITHFQTRKAALLLAKLALNLDRPCSRDELIETLWPDEYLDAARERFRQTLSSLRKALNLHGEDPPLETDRLTVRLDPQRVTADVADFDRGLKAARRDLERTEKVALLERSLALYEGPLLQGYSEEWILAARTNYEETFVDGLTRLAALCAESGDVAAAINHARRAVEADPLREESRHVMIGLLGRAGRSSEAARQFKEYEALVLKELGAKPSRALATLVSEVQSGALEQEHAIQVPSVAIPNVAPPPARAEDAATAFAAPAIEAPLTRFFGREEELAQLEDWLVEASGESPRLITLTGPGGCGKTRLALQFARSQVAGGQWHVVYVPLVGLVKAESVPEAIRERFGYRTGSDADALDSVRNAIRERPTLVVLDNFEHLVDDGAPIVEALLQSSESVRILVTSRQRLNLLAETELPVPPLPTPHRPGTPEEVARYPSVRLFLDRVKKVRPQFALDDENVHAVVALCEFLDGIPLALELAAARAGLLSPSQLLAQLEDRFDFLATRQKDVPERHRTLRTAIEWSYLSLEPERQKFFRKLTVFRGSWSLEAAQYVAGEKRALDFIEDLRDKSLLVPVPAGAEIRFRILETLRSYGAELLTEAERKEAAAAHVRFYVRRAVEFQQAEVDEGYSKAVPLMMLRLDNVRQALETALDPEDPMPEEALELVSKLSHFWEAAGIQREGRTYALRALALESKPSDVRRRTMSLVSDLSLGLGEPAAGLEWARKSVEMALALGDERGIIGSLGAALAAENRNKNFAEARQYEEQLLARYDSISDPNLKSLTATNLGNSAFMSGRFEDARSFYATALEDAKRGNSERELGFSYTNVGEMLYLEGKYREAMDHFELGLAVMRRARLQLGIVDCFRQLSQTAVELDTSVHRAREVAIVLGFQEKHREGMGYPIEPEFLAAYHETIRVLRERLGEAAFQEAWQQGRRQDLSETGDMASRW